jgi:dihydrofolate synthase/folylpolyglutamate synthase
VARLAAVFGATPGAGFRTTFEHLTALGLLAFQEAGVERAVIEVGLGGRLDATNVIPAGPVVITPVSLDHQHVLGNTVGRLASDKAHVIKPGGTAFVMPQAAPARKATRSSGTARMCSPRSFSPSQSARR